MNTNETLKAAKATIIDVRTPEEFRMGHVAGSVNIPLQEILSRVDEIRSMEAPLVLCCASGNRSGMATSLLQREGVDCSNGGGWMDVEYQISRMKMA
jgi:rhodanese-related sulfurtransferase